MPERIRQLTANNPFAEWEAQALAESGVKVHAEPVIKSVQLMARFRIWGRRPENVGKLFVVHDYADMTKDQTEKGRPPGWGIPGGKVKPEETPRQALEHEKGEIGHPIVGIPIYSHKFDVEYYNRIERIYVFDTTIDEITAIERACEEAKEVDKGEFVPFEEIPNAELVDTRDDAPPQPEDGVFRMFLSHRNLATAWGKDAGYEWKIRLGWRRPASK